MEALIGDSGSLRRVIAGLVAMVSVVANKKLGLEISEDMQANLVYLAMAYIATSNAKEAMVKRAQEASKAAAVAVKPEEAEAVLKDAAKKGSQDA